MENNKSFWIDNFEIEDFKNNPQLQTEVNGLYHMLFTSVDMAERFIKKNCPLLSSCIERWKLLTELREHSQEARVIRK